MILGLFMISTSALAESGSAIKVACIGNSITFGDGIKDRLRDAYPEQLGRMLGDGYVVRNFGVSGRTLLSNGDYPWIKEKAFRDALAWEPNVVIIKLGTNDSKPQNWTFKAEFEADYKKLLAAFQQLKSTPKIFMCQVVPVFPEAWGISDTVVRTEVNPLIKKIASDSKIPLIDLYTPFIGKAALFPDKVHPSAEGSGEMAKVVYKQITGRAGKLVSAAFPGKKSNWNGFDLYDFTVSGRASKVVVPAKVAAGKPWIWRARFWGHEPQTEIALLKKGYHVAYIDVVDMFGNNRAVHHWNEFYNYLVKVHDFSPKAVLEGLSRGGLIVYNWGSANPQKVACIYADAPVCDINSWPGGGVSGNISKENWLKCLKAYKISRRDARRYKNIPINNCVSLARAGVPVLHVVGDADKIVPVEENTFALAKKYREAGGEIKIIVKKGVGHHPHSLEDPTEIVNFIEKAVAKR